MRAEINQFLEVMERDGENTKLQSLKKIQPADQ